MAEPEDLILDGAQMVSRQMRQVWLRYAPPAPPNVLRLVDVRLRVELFLNALFETPLVVTAADAPAPVSWLGRVAGRGGAWREDAVAGTDGTRIYLPPVFDSATGVERAFQLCLLLAVQQAVRVMRGSTAIALNIDDAAVRDRFLIAEAVAVDDWIAREAAGLVPALRTARLNALTRRPQVRSQSADARASEQRLREFLASDPALGFDRVPLCRTASDSHHWARTRPEPETRANGVPPPSYWGRPYAPADGAVGAGGFDAGIQPPVTRRRVAELRRRPRIREAGEDEDDAGAGTWVIRADEPQESVEDPFGLQRPADRSDDVDPEALGDSLAELPEARVVRTPGQAREILRAGDERPRTIGATAPASTRAGIAYPEWDHRTGTYRRPGAIVRETEPVPGNPAWALTALARHATLVRRVRTRFERLRPRRSRIGRQADGPELDIEACVNAAADGRAGVVAEDRLYVDVRPRRRELAVALLVDVSASTDSWVAGDQRIVDVQKDALLVVCEALAALGDRHAILAFSGEGAEHVSVVTVKAFAEPAGEAVRCRIGALEADGYTRVGAAVRHATAAVCGAAAERRLLLILSDGKPNDVDAYDGPYGIEDTRQAVAEAHAQNVHVFCVTVDREAPRYAPRIFGRAGFTLLRRPDQLPEVLVGVLRHLIHR